MLWLNYREHEDNGYWEPGDVIPVSQTSRSQTQDTSTVLNVLQGFQGNVEKQLLSIHEKLENIEERMDALECSQGVIEKEMKSAKCSNKTTVVSPAYGRKRITPTALQVSKFIY